ncbi:MAG: alpha-ketoglutarate-dependent dioxygenase AlkB [Thiofilum sp.]|uniref:alpha-ketoglutarate-dependent dioxygenase AlkB n=1 Tax=Thiofilum sp. TaxID=2212733 RepID=UPI0025F17033|nr:alpha-ketoglutarate-dependent dioxygenase AlkB [Thiofilum sp.]MBK8455386.1 alpha-ketoglutarate-dependent dioxygenase AlkB [Thiofilum sp.]
MTTLNVHFNPNFITQSLALFEFIKTNIQWDERMRARKTASFGVPYNYSQIDYPIEPMPDYLNLIAQKIESELGFLPNNCLLNYYPDGQSSMGFHSDSSVELELGTGVAILSLGSNRPIVYQYKVDRSIEYIIDLPSGSLLYMSKAIQDDWVHAIPKQGNVGERISVTFRKIKA